MNQRQLYEILVTSGIPFRYQCWPENGAPSPPYGIFRLVQETNFYADGKIYFSGSQFNIELYAAIKNSEAEKRLEAVLNSAGITFEKSEYSIETEHLLQTLYEIEV